MASNWNVCGVCDSLKIGKPSVVWCSECDEGLCAECDKHHAVSRASRTHNLIQINEYNKLPTEILEISHHCLKHNEKFQIYCRKHECPCCRRCVIETHNDCKDITALDDVIKDVKSSNGLNNIELMLTEEAENLEKYTKDRKDNLASLKDQKRKIEIEIQQKRIKINTHLDQLQEDLMIELNTIEEIERNKIKEILTSLGKKKNEIKKYKTTLSNIKQYASELQTFLAIREIENNVSNEEFFLETLSTSTSLGRIVLSLDDDDSFFQTISNFKSIGQIDVEMKPSELMMTRIKGAQAQLKVVNDSTRLIEDIKLNLKQTVNTGLSDMKGCLILPDGRLVLSCIVKNLVRVFNSNGNKEFEINLNPCSVSDITFIPEDNTIAATSGGKGIHNISFIDLKNRTVSKQIRVNFSYSGVLYNDFRLITCADTEGLHILKYRRCKVIEKIKNKEMSSSSFVAAFDNKMYYTNKDHCTVTCCDMKGTDLWTFKDLTVLQYPKGITVDNDGNVYVASQSSHTVIVLSSDGKRSLELLSAKDGLRYPNVLNYDRSNDQLLVGNESQTAFLFQIISKN